MGSGSSKPIRCPQCQTFKTNDGNKFYNHVTNEHAEKSCSNCLKQDDVGQSNNGFESVGINSKFLICPECSINDIENEVALLSHIKSTHVLTNHNGNNELIICSECYTEVAQKDLSFHMKNLHFEEHSDKMTCSMCSEPTKFENINSIIKHLEENHNYRQIKDINDLNKNTDGNRMLPKVGDKVLAMWSKSKWQYFHATIARFIPSTLRYEIDWDDGDTTGRVVDYFNIAVDKIPDRNEIGINSIILFGQGQYKAGDTQLTGGLRWHQGKITQIYKSPDGKFDLYDGEHTKFAEDGKFSTYKGYSVEFTGYKLEDLRVGPNVFDILEDIDGEEDGAHYDDIDIYFSLEQAQSGPLADTDECSPKEIESILKNSGLKVISSDQENLKKDLKRKARMLRDSKVFIACICNDYALDPQCRMEFQYAKSTLRKPVVPLVFGKGMDWTKSVVGMLIAGELYIHMKDKSVQEQKLQEIISSINNHIGSKETLDTIANTTSDSISNQKPGDVFVSYCWTNSFLAKENKQIDIVSGTQFSDPRLVAQKLGDDDFATWLDIERLKSANQGSGLFEQLTTALTEAKVVVAFISDEYTLSKNCQMEFQFSLKSLNKPVIPVVVGSGNKWEQTVVGFLLSTNHLELVDMRHINDDQTFNEKLELIKDKLRNYLTGKVEKPIIQGPKFRAPQKGDHVISHHFKYCYYMATVVEFDKESMQYTVAWDDGDATGTVQDYDQVALDVVPDEDDIGVGSNVFFVQGSYVIDGTPGVRYHEGIVTNIARRNNTLYFDGHHRYGEDDGKFCGFRYYYYTFKNLESSELRMASSALDVYMTS